MASTVVAPSTSRSSEVPEKSDSGAGGLDVDWLINKKGQSMHELIGAFQVESIWT